MKIVFIALTLPLASSRAALADEPFTIGSRPAWFLLGGVTGGGTVGLDDRSGYVGGELSLARLREGRYVGLYGDAYYDFGIDGTYATGGLEAGRGPFGIDGGVALRFANDTVDLGPTVRLSVGVGVLAVYARYARFDSPSHDDVLQVGAMVKLPLIAPGGGR
jgi:hypothetical protein